jgi:hypothetical protein
MKKEDLTDTIANLSIEKVIPFFKEEENHEGLFNTDYNNYFTKFGGINILELRLLFDSFTHYQSIGILIDENKYYLPGLVAFISFCDYNNIKLFIIYKDQDEYSIQPLKSRYWYNLYNGGI